MAEKSQVAAAKNTFVGRRLARNAEDPHFVVEGGQHRFLVPAFFEKRPGANISVDLMWLEGNASSAQQQKVIVELSAIAKNDGHNLAGWAGAKAEEILRVAKDAVEQVIATPRAGVNERHGDIVAREFLRVVEPGDAEAKRRANIVAKYLAEAYNRTGRYVEPAPSLEDSPPVTSSEFGSLRSSTIAISLQQTEQLHASREAPVELTQAESASQPIRNSVSLGLRLWRRVREVLAKLFA